MDSKDIFSFIKSNISLITDKWFNEVKKSKYMQTYHSLKDEEIKKRGEGFYKNLLEWINTGSSTEKVEVYFLNIGKERLDEGIPLTEINYAVFLTKKVFWDFISSKDEIERFLISAKTCELITLLNNYFDIGSFYIIKGYLNQFFNKLDETKKFTKKELEGLLVKGALYKETQKKSDKDMFESFNLGSRIGILR